MDLGTLNTRQRDAVTSTEGRIRVVAGAGSGKTKAAQEMKSRISQLVPASPMTGRTELSQPVQLLYKQEYIPGERMEFDWGEVKIFIDGELREMHVVSDGMSCFEAHTSV